MALTLLLAGGGAVAGAFGALLGLGGGILIVPFLTLVFGVSFREAVAVSLLAVITTSSAGAAVYLERRVADLRLGMTLELATAVGGLVGGLIAFALSERLLAAGFAMMLAYTSFTMLRAGRRDRTAAMTPPGVDTELSSTPSPRATLATGLGDAAVAGSSDATGVDRATGTGGEADDAETRRTADAPAGAGRGESYVVRRLPLGFSLSAFAGIVAALMGVGGGLVKVPVMHLVMGVPLRVATATSNLMIGVTASASAVFYLLRGAVDPYVAAPVVAGVFVGASAASRMSHRVPVPILRLLFVAVLMYVSIEMAARALGFSLLAVPRD